jgi:DNA-binding transcriptional MerR regulator
MPYKEKETFKLYYSIGEVSELLDVNPSLLRFWEKEFDLVHPNKNKKGNRIYTEKDVKNLRMIHYLVKERGFTLDGAKKKLKEDPKELEEKSDLIDTLNGVKTLLLELKESL